jgi:hypothetical protein
VAQVLFDYHAEGDPRILEIAAGEILDILGDNEGWLVAVTADGREGHVPPSYVEEFEEVVEFDPTAPDLGVPT